MILSRMQMQQSQLQQKNNKDDRIDAWQAYINVCHVSIMEKNYEEV